MTAIKRICRQFGIAKVPFFAQLDLLKVAIGWPVILKTVILSCSVVQAPFANQLELMMLVVAVAVPRTQSRIAIAQHHEGL